MVATIHLPDDLAGEVQRRAAAVGRDLSAEVVDLLRQALVTSPPATTLVPAVLKHDPVTGLLVIESPPDAPIHRMTSEQVQVILERALEEQDLEQIGILVRR